MNKVAKGGEAERLLDNPLFKEAQEAIDKVLWETFVTSPIADDDGRMRLRIFAEINRKYLSYLRQVMDDGKIELAAQQEESRLKKIKRAVGF
jgi:hypothetical protein